MKRGRWAADERILLEKSVNGVIKTSMLRSLGVASKTVVDRTSGGPWQRILPGIVLLNNGTPTRTQRNVAASMYVGEGAILSGRAGLALHGFGVSTQPSETLVLLPQTRHRKDASFVVVERTWRVPKTEKKGPISVAPIDRCLLDAARRMRDPRACTALIAEVVQHGRADVRSLLAELNDGCGRGSAMPRTVLYELSGGAHSIAEVDAQKLMMQSSLPPALRNVSVYTDAGVFLGVVDNWWDVGVVCEVDSFRHHASPEDYRKTVERRNAMQNEGVIVTNFTPKTILTQPNLVIATLENAYRQALRRPRPNVRAVVSDNAQREAS